jgi:hypothetical protein
MKQFDLSPKEQQAQELVAMKQIIIEDLTQQFYIKLFQR